jgi:hypothetical protein
VGHADRTGRPRRARCEPAGRHHGNP